MSCAHNCIFVVNILQYILSKLILYLNFVKLEILWKGIFAGGEVEVLCVPPKYCNFFWPSV